MFRTLGIVDQFLVCLGHRIEARSGTEEQRQIVPSIFDLFDFRSRLLQVLGARVRLR
jgi:hypothetical protein